MTTDGAPPQNIAHRPFGLWAVAFGVYIWYAGKDRSYAEIYSSVDTEKCGGQVFLNAKPTILNYHTDRSMVFG